MSDIGNPRGAGFDLGSDVRPDHDCDQEGMGIKTRACFCCDRECKRGTFTQISATTSGKCLDGTNAEDRTVCNKCHQI